MAEHATSGAPALLATLAKGGLVAGEILHIDGARVLATEPVVMEV